MLSEDFSLPSPLPPYGSVFDVEEIVVGKEDNFEDIDVSISLNSYCIFWKDLVHVDSMRYEIGVGFKKLSDDVIPLHPINGSFSNVGWTFCETTTQLKTYQKYYVYLNVVNSGGSHVSLSTDGFVIIDPKEFDHFIKVNDGQGCELQNRVVKQNLTSAVQNDTKFIVQTSVPLVIGAVYTAFINVSMCDFNLYSKEVLLLAESGNSFTFVPQHHQPMLTLSSNCSLDVGYCVLEIFRCEENIQVQSQFDTIGANWKINDTLGDYISHYKVSLMSCGKTKDTLCETLSSTLVTKERTSIVFQDVNHLQTEGFYKISLQVCFGNNCMFGGQSDGFYIESNGPDIGSLSAELDLKSDDCAHLTLRFTEFRCSFPLDPFVTFYKWALFTDSNEMIQITSHNIRVNDTGNHELNTCISLPNHPHKAMQVCLEGYCASGRMSKTCAPVVIKQETNTFNKEVVYDLDARSKLFTELEAYKYTRNIGNKIKDIHTNEINFRAKAFKLGGFVIGLGNTDNLWSVMKSAHVPVRCIEDDDCVVSKLGKGGLIEFSSRLPLKHNTLYFTCVNVSKDPSLSRCSNGFTIDSDPPSKGKVTVQATKRGYITDEHQSFIHWLGFDDNILSRNFGYPSSIKIFEIAVGTKKENDDVLLFRKVGITSAISLSNVSLFGGTSYYFSVKAYDHAGNFIIGSSDSYIFDSTPPEHGRICVGQYLGHLSYVSSIRLAVHLSGFLDNESGIEKIEIGVGSTNNSADVIPVFEHYYTLNPIEIPEKGELFDGHVYYIFVRVWNYAGLYTTLSSDPFVFDSSPPETGIVRDGHRANNVDVDYTRNSTLSIHWTEFVDRHSHVEFYRIGLGSEQGLTDVKHFIYIGKRLEWEWTIPLVPGKRYFSTVEGCNIAGLCSQSTSNGVNIDSSPPVPGYVSIGPGNVKYIPQRSFLSLEWGNFVDVESGIEQYDVCVSRDASNCDVLPWKNFRTQQSALLLNISLPTNEDLYAIIRARNKAGLSTRRSSHSFRVDDSPPFVTRSPKFVIKENASSIYDTSVLNVEWGYTDTESPIKFTVVSLKLHDGGHTEIDNIIVQGNSTFVKSLTPKEWLRDGDSYYVVVTACNMAGLCASNKSKSVVFDGTPPVHGHVLDDGTWSNTNATLTFNWKDYSDPESGVKSYYITIGDTHSGSEISQRTMNVIHSGKTNSTQSCIFNISRFLKAGDKIVFSIWARNNANLNGTVRRVTFIVVPSSQNNSDGRLIIERHSCSVSYCTNDCTCATLGGKCSDVMNMNICQQINITQLSDSSKIKVNIFGPHSEEWTPSTRCLSIEWKVESVNALRYEWSLGLSKMPIGNGVFDIANENVWHDVSLERRVVYCLKPERQLLHARSYTAYLKTWVSETEYLLTESKPIIIDTTPPSVRRGKFIIDSDTDCRYHKRYTKTRNLLTCWQGVFSDTQSGIKQYKFMIGVRPGGYEISGILSVGLATNISWNLSNLESGVKYFTSVEAINFVGHSTLLTSNGITIDSTAPGKGTVYTTKFFYNKRWLTDTTTMSASWEGFFDYESSINHYLFSIMDADHKTVVPELNVGILNTYTLSNLSLVHGISYVVTVRAEDTAGHRGSVSSSELFTIDTTKPTGLQCSGYLEQLKISRKISTNERHVINAFQLNQSTLYKMIIEGNIYLQKHIIEIEINGTLYDVPVYTNTSEITFMSLSSSTELSLFIHSLNNQNITMNISLLMCANSHVSDEDAIVVRQISENYLTIAANVFDKDSGIKHLELYLGTCPNGRQIKTVRITSSFTFHQVFLPIPHGTTLYVSAMAENNADLKQNFVTKPIVWDHTPPTIYIRNVSVNYIDESGDIYSLILAEWEIEENESAVAYCQCALGKHMGILDIETWKNSNDLYSCQPLLYIPHGTHVFLSVRCFNKVGLYTEENENQPIIVSFIPPQPLSDDINFAVHSAITQNIMNIQSVATSLQFHWLDFHDLSQMSSYSVCIKTDHRIIYDWKSIGTHNYLSVDGLSLGKTSNYTVFVRGKNVGEKQSKTINSSISIIDILPIQTGNSCSAEAKSEKDVLVSWKNVFSLNFYMEPHFVVYIGSNVGMADLVLNLKTSETDVLISTKSKQLYVVITAKYITGSETRYREMINVKP